MSALAVELHARRASHRTWAGVVTALLCVAALALPTPGIGLQLGLAALVIVALGLPHGALDAMVAEPPSRLSRPSMESRMPRRSAGTALGSNPQPISRTKTSIRLGPTSA